jgi:hypothetical protein
VRTSCPLHRSEWVSRLLFFELLTGVIFWRRQRRHREPMLVLLYWLIVFMPGLAVAADDSVPLDQTTAMTVEPYAKMACGAYQSCAQGDLAGTGYTIDMDWKQAMRQAGVGERIISLYERAGFSATIYRNDRSKELVVAYRGSEGSPISGYVRTEVAGWLEKHGFGSNAWEKGDWVTDIQARDLKSPTDMLIAQYVAARSLGSRIGKVYSATPYRDYKLSLTGDSLGGALASYTGQHVNANVYTIEPARNTLAGTGTNPKQINIIVTRDAVSDPNAPFGKIAGSPDLLPGRTYRVDLSPPPKQLPPTPDLRQRHGAELVVSRIRDIATTGRTTGPQFSRPGGISLSKAAAERMPLNITLDGSYYSDGRIVLMGKRDPAHSIDAALFLTSLRLACDSADPYFSLDPVEGAAWNREGEEATVAFWERISANFNKQPNVKQKDSIFSIRTISAKRDYPQIWASMERNYPNLKSKLVFRPTWLEGTRFGEILYRADVLLKELSGGVPVLEPGPVRASKIENYVSSTARFTAQGLLASYERKADSTKPSWQGHRLWFDLTSYQPRSTTPYVRPVAIAPMPQLEVARACGPNDRRCQQQSESELHKILNARGLLPVVTPAMDAPVIANDGMALDLSGVFPRMFVRKHDHVTRSDLPGLDPPLGNLSADVNRRTERYAAAYKELRALTEVFRAYVAAVHITRSEPSVCHDVRSLSLLEGEKVASRMPPYHPTELFITLASFEYTDGKFRRLLSNRGSSLNGGIAIRARAYFEEALKTGTPTEITKLINVQSTAVREDTSWQASNNQHFIAFLIRPPAAEAGVPQVRAPAPVRGNSR